ncbi:DUF3908 domain-containing protein [Clostridium botulinum]|uniref:DUF3908 domain-containing protein n=1 Tax=Clostridium botulinum TaxID=1491 RepID=A0A6B4K9E2_CLOBO|nr:DUF3908 family protein [Clostridium botulinum]KEI83387.1 hypothetical protein N487_00295 [Clostridium botulinum B2 331]KEI93981.1 hypothetical protein N491_00295 [Clostridium botulinum B2 275]NFA91041.1 DUF3908 domain-containing protein [Clostridium botulinum]NFB21231.1 DUF3908 domain-containing protein [Clostridium botulinum]NFD76929.1 DUF3908 domain-containing protein [Clostridium botulinum]
MNRMSTFKYLVEGLGRPEYKQEFFLLNELKQLNINLENVILYFKGLFVDDADKILYVFSDAKFYILSINKGEENTLEVQILNINEIKNIKYIKEYYDNKFKLSFIVNDVTVKLNPKLDTNMHHVHNYNEIVQEIISKLIN